MKRIAILAAAALAAGCASETVDDTEGQGAAQSARAEQSCGPDLAKHDTPAKALRIPGSLHDESNHYLGGTYSLKPGQTGYLKARFDDPVNVTAYQTRYSLHFRDGDAFHPGAWDPYLFAEISFACDNAGDFDLNCKESTSPMAEPDRPCVNKNSVSIAPDCSGRNDGGYATIAVTRRGDPEDNNPCANFRVEIMATLDGLWE